jgi:hypothetical protein
MTSHELAISIIMASGGDIKRAAEAASIIDAWKSEQATQLTCDHADWSFEKHGRCCFKCGAFVVDFGD